MADDADVFAASMAAAAAEVLPEVSAEEAELLAAQHTTAEEQRNARWAASENRRHEDTRVILQKLRGLSPDSERSERYLYSDRYRQQIAALPAEQRSALTDKSGEDIATYLDELAAMEHDQKRQQEALDKQAAEAAEAQFNETPALRELRHEMKAGQDRVAAKKKEIAWLGKYETLRKDRTASGSEEMLTPEEHSLWRQGKLPDRSGELQAKVAELQAELAETGNTQNAYYAEARTIQPQPGYAPPPGSVPSQPSIVQIVDNNGQAMMQIPAAQYEALRQMDRENDAHFQRVQEAGKKYGRDNWEQAARQSAAAWRSVGEPVKAYIRSMPNSGEIEYQLSTHPDAIMLLARMGDDAWRGINQIAVNLGARANTHEAPRTTSAPKPPVPVTGSSSSRQFDPYDESTSTSEWFVKRTRDVERRKNRHS